MSPRRLAALQLTRCLGLLAGGSANAPLAAATFGSAALQALRAAPRSQLGAAALPGQALRLYA